MTLSEQQDRTSLVASIPTGAREFHWRRLAYRLAMAGAAGASIALLLLATGNAYAAVPTAHSLTVPGLAAEPTSMLEELRDNFLMWSLLFGSVILMGLVLPFVLSGLFAIGARIAMYAAAASLLLAGAALIAGTWLAAYVSSGAMSATTRRASPRLSRIEAEMRQALQILLGRGVAR